MQCTQLDEANQAWQQYHQTQVDSFTNKLQKSLPIENSLPLDDIAQHIVARFDQQQNEHENLMQQLQTFEKLNNDLRSGKTFAFRFGSNVKSFVSVKNQRINKKQYNRHILTQ
jgi:hypothetical protein